jgi:hypothetical protein
VTAVCAVCGWARSPDASSCPICGSELPPFASSNLRLRLTQRQPEELACQWFVEQPEVLIGRVPPADVVLAHPSVSRRHARIAHGPDAYLVEDLDSKNQTHLNEHPVEGPTRLSHGDLLMIGSVVLLVEFVPLELPASPPDSNEPHQTIMVGLGDALAVAPIPLRRGELAQQAEADSHPTLVPDAPATVSEPSPSLEPAEIQGEEPQEIDVAEGRLDVPHFDSLVGSAAYVSQVLAALSQQLACGRQLFEEAGGRAALEALIGHSARVDANPSDVGALVAFARVVHRARYLLEAQLYITEVVWPSRVESIADQEAQRNRADNYLIPPAE